MESVRILITAEEACPEMERTFLNARRRILASCRVFDPTTRLRSREGRAVGDDGFALIVHVLQKGVEIDLVISGFDPILAHDLHGETWPGETGADRRRRGGGTRGTASRHRVAPRGPGRTRRATSLLGATAPGRTTAWRMTRTASRPA